MQVDTERREVEQRRLASHQRAVEEEKVRTYFKPKTNVKWNKKILKKSRVRAH